MTSLGKTGRYVYLVREPGCEQLHTFPVKKKNNNPYKLTLVLRTARYYGHPIQIPGSRVPDFCERLFWRILFSRFQYAHMRKEH